MTSSFRLNLDQVSGLAACNTSPFDRSRQPETIEAARFWTGKRPSPSSFSRDALVAAPAHRGITSRQWPARAIRSGDVTPADTAIGSTRKACDRRSDFEIGASLSCEPWSRIALPPERLATGTSISPAARFAPWRPPRLFAPRSSCQMNRPGMLDPRLSPTNSCGSLTDSADQIDAAPRRLKLDLADQARSRSSVMGLEMARGRRPPRDQTTWRPRQNRSDRA